MNKISVKHQDFWTRLWMFLFPWFMAVGFMLTTSIIFQGGNAIANYPEWIQFYASLGLLLGSLGVLIISFFQDKIVSRYLLIYNIFLMVIALNYLFFFKILSFPGIYGLEIILLSVFIGTIFYSPYGFIGIQYKKRSSIIYSSSIFFVLLASLFALYSFRGWEPGFFLVQYWILRKVVLYFFDETKTTSMVGRILGVLFSFTLWILIFYGIAQVPNLPEYYFLT